jgi:hypothetical protein
MKSTLLDLPIDVLAFWLQAGDVAMLYLCGDMRMNARLVNLQELVSTEISPRAIHWPSIVLRLPNLKRFKWICPSTSFWDTHHRESLLPYQQLPSTLEALEIEHNTAEISWVELCQATPLGSNHFAKLSLISFSSINLVISTSHINSLPRTLTSISLSPSLSISWRCLKHLPPNLVNMSFRVDRCIPSNLIKLIPRTVERLTSSQFSIAAARYLPPNLTYLSLGDIDYDPEKENLILSIPGIGIGTDHVESSSDEENDELLFTTASNRDETSNTFSGSSYGNVLKDIIKKNVDGGSNWRFISELPDSVQTLQIGALSLNMFQLGEGNARQRQSIAIPRGLKWPLSLTQLELLVNHQLEFQTLPRTLLHLVCASTVFTNELDDDVGDISIGTVPETPPERRRITSFLDLPQSLLSLTFIHHIELSSPEVLSTLPRTLTLLRIPNILNLEVQSLGFLAHLTNFRSLSISLMPDEAKQGTLQVLGPPESAPSGAQEGNSFINSTSFSSLASRSLTFLSINRSEFLPPSCIESLPRALLHLDAPIRGIDSHHLQALPPNLFTLIIHEITLIDDGVFPRCLRTLICDRAEHIQDGLIAKLPRTLTNLRLKRSQKLTNQCVSALPPRLTELDLSSSCFIDSDCFTNLPQQLVILRLYRRLQLDFIRWLRSKSDLGTAH